MSRYVDGSIVLVPIDKLDSYSKLFRQCGAEWKGNGTLQYRECMYSDSQYR